MSTILPDTVWPSCEFLNLECMFEMCCTWLTGNTGPKKSPKMRHLGTIVQLCRTIASQLRHISTIGKNMLNSNISSTCAINTVNFGPLAAEIHWRVWGTPVIMVALWNRADHYSFALWLLSIFFSSPNLSGRRLDVYHTSTHGVALVRI